MIVIDKQKPIQNIFLTLTELTTVDNPKYLLVMKCDATRNIYKLFLPENLSPAIERYDLFKINTPVFKDMEAGYYSYAIYQQLGTGSITDESLLGDAIDYGKVLIKAAVIPANEDYIIYNI